MSASRNYSRRKCPSVRKVGFYKDQKDCLIKTKSAVEIVLRSACTGLKFITIVTSQDGMKFSSVHFMVYKVGSVTCA